MHDSLRGWVEGGGRLLYLGGNGWTSDVTWHPERPWLMENRTTGRMRVTDTATLTAEAWNQGDGEKGGQLADTGRSPGSLFGVDTSTMTRSGSCGTSSPASSTRRRSLPRTACGIPDRSRDKDQASA
jgi:N,N-dimethylformamidase